MNEDIGKTVARLMNEDISSTVARLMNEDIGSTVAGEISVHKGKVDVLNMPFQIKEAFS